MEDNSQNRRKRQSDENERNMDEGSKFRKGDYIFIFVLLMLVIASVVIYFSGQGEKSLEEASIGRIEYEASDKADFYVYEDNIFYVAKDSVKMFDGKLNEQWSESCNIMNPVVCGSGNTVAVAEKGGSTIKVFNEKGMAYDAAFEGSLVTFGTGADGSVGAIYRADSDYKLKIFNPSGEVPFTGDYAAANGVPMGIDISDDGRICAVAVMTASGLDIESNIIFYYINADEKKPVTQVDSSGMFASLVHNGLPFKVSFTGDNRCMVLLDNAFLFINPEDMNDESRCVEVPLANKVSFACINGDGTLAAVMGEKLLNTEDGAEENTVLWYNSKGERINEYKPQKIVTGLYPGENVTVIAMDRSFDGVSNGGHLQWSYTATQDMTKVLPYDGNSKMLAASYVGAVLAKAGKGSSLTEIETGSEGTTLTVEGSTRKENPQTETKAQNTTGAEAGTQVTTKPQAETNIQTTTKAGA